MLEKLRTKGRVLAGASDDPEHYRNWFGLLAAVIWQAHRDLQVEPRWDSRGPSDLDQAEAQAFLQWATEEFSV